MRADSPRGCQGRTDRVRVLALGRPPGPGRHRPVLVTATVTTAALYLVFPLGFVPEGEQLTGLARLAHDHLLGIAILLIPTLILLADELRRKGEETADTAPRAHVISRQYLIGGVVFLVVLVWMAGTNAAGLVLGLGVLVVAGALFLWHKDRVAMRSVRRDLNPPENP